MNLSERRRLPQAQHRRVAILPVPLRPFRAVAALAFGAAAAAATRPEARGRGLRQSPVAAPAPAEQPAHDGGGAGALAQVAGWPVHKPESLDQDSSSGGYDSVWPGAGLSQSRRRGTGNVVDPTARRRWSSIWGKRREKGYYLPKTELEKINTIDCLKAKQKNPTAKCAGPQDSQALSDMTYSPPWSLGNYPTWKHPICNSGGEYFCDPDNALSPEAQSNISSKLKEMRETTVVNCNYGSGPLDQEKMTFYLGVAVAKQWPDNEADPASLQQFGLLTMSQWGMDGMGSQLNYAACSNTALLIVLPQGPHVLLASPSCSFICKDMGGPMVHTSVLQYIDSGGGLQQGIEAGIKAVKGFVLNRRPDWNSVPKPKAFWAEAAQTESAYTLWQQLILAAVILIVVLSGLFVFINAMFPAFAHSIGISTIRISK